MDRTQRLLAGLLAGQIVLIGLLQFVSPASRAAVKEQPLLPALAAMTPQKVEIGDGTGASVTLDHEGSTWALDSPKGYPVAAGKVEKLIGDIEKLTVTRPVVSNRRNHAALKVAEDGFERRVRIWEKPGGKPSAELFVGTSPRFQASHVRVGGKDPVYEATGINSYDLPADPGSWVDRSLVAVPTDSLAEFGLSNRKGSFQLERKDGRWSVRAPASRARAALDATKVESLVRTLCNVALDAPAGPESDPAYRLGSPDATMVIKRMPAAGDSAAAGVSPVVVRIGAPVPGKEGRYAARSGSGYAVTIPKFTADRALEATLAELLAK